MVDLSIDEYSADQSGDKKIEEKEELDDLKVTRKKRTKKLKLKDSDYDSDNADTSDDESLKKNKSTKKNKVKTVKSNKENDEKFEGDSCVSGVSSDSSSSDEEDENEFIKKLLKVKNVQENVDIKLPSNDLIQNQEEAQDSPPKENEANPSDSSEEEMYNEIVKNISPKKTEASSVKEKESPKRKKKESKKKKRKIESDRSESDDDDGVEGKCDSNDNDGVEDQLQDISDEDIIGENDMNDLEKDKEFLNERNIKPRKMRQAAKESENAMKEIRSEQQRLQRERACEIPYHKPKAKSVKEFLKRVPSLPSRKTRSTKSEKLIDLVDENNSPQEKLNKESIFSRMPVLAPRSGDLEFILEDETVFTPKPVKRVDSFMNKVVKHIKTPISDQKKKEHTTDKAWSNTQLKSELRGKIKEKRQKQYEEIEEKRKKLEDQIALEEGEESFDDADDESDSSQSENSEDEEIEKWNVEENRVRLEESMEVEEEKKKKETKNENEDEIDEKEDDGDDGHVDFQKVPTQLLKSDLLHSHSNSDFVKKDSMLVLPCENTQDMYKDDSRISSLPEDDEDESDTELGPNFHLSLDEDTQFTQHILDSQGFLTNKKPAPKEQAKIFEEKPDEPTNSTFSMTQMLGLCSGKFSGDVPLLANSPENSTNQNSLDFHDDNANNTFSNFTFTENKEESDVSNTGKSGDNKTMPEDKIESGITEDSTTNTKDNEGMQENADEEIDDIEKEDESAVKGIEEVSVELPHGDVKEEDEDEDHQEPFENNDKEELEAEEEDDEEENEELKEWNEHLKKGDKKWNKKAFYEDEAELSGSDVGSDDEDLGSEFDEYEEDSDFEDLPDDEKLKKQLHKIHQKKMNDQDKREMRLLQELYLEDEFGDSEKRKRNFRWRNIDQNFNNENASNEAVDEADNYSEIKERNKDLVERNRYLLELEESQSQTIELDENSQMVLEKINGSSTGIRGSTSQVPATVDFSQKIAPLRRSGSFLRDVKNSKASPVANFSKNAVNKNAKSFVFQALNNEPKKVKKAVDDKHAPPRKRARNENTPTTNTEPKLTAKSIFSLL